MLVRLLAVLACALGLVLPAASPTAAAQADGPGEETAASGVVVVGASGLTLDDLSPETTPNLWSMVENGAAGNLSVRTLTPATCAASGWLSVGAGARMLGVDLTPAWQHPLFLDRSCPRMVEPSHALARPAGGDETGGEEASGSPQNVGPLPTGLAPASFAEYHRVEDANARAGYGAEPGAFSRSAADPAADSAGNAAEPARSWCTAAIGTGAAFAAADDRGRIDQWAPLSALLDDEAEETRTAQLTSCPLTLVDAGTAADPMWDPAASAIWAEHTLGSLRSGQIQELDARVGLVLDAVPDDHDVVVAGVGDAAYPSRLRALLATGPSYPVGTLESSSTRQPGLAQLTDILPATLRNAGLEPAGTSPAAFTVDTSRSPVEAASEAVGEMGEDDQDGREDGPSGEGAADERPGDEDEAAGAGSWWNEGLSGASSEAEARMETLIADARKAATVHGHVQTFGIVVDILFYALFVFAAIVFAKPVMAAMRRRGVRAQKRADAFRPAAAVAADGPRAPLTGWRTWTAWICFAFGMVPVASFLAGLAPWGRAPDPEMALAGAIAAATVLLLLVAVVGPWRRTWAGRIAAVCLVSAVVLVADVALGSRLQFNSLMGYNPIVAGRFYGLGNQGAALFLVAAPLGLGIVAARLIESGRAGWARSLTAVFALVSVFVLGNPAWGAKFGGTIAALVGFTVLLLSLWRIRVSLLRLVVIGAGALAVIVGVAGLDYLREPADRSHFGNFFAQALDGELFEVISRKLEANLRIMVINPGLAIVVPLGLLIVLFSLAYLRRYRRTAFLARPWDGRLPEALDNADVHAGFLSAVIALAVGLVITDSGIAVPATGALMLVPLLVVMSLDAAQRDEAAGVRAGREDGPAGSTAGRPPHTAAGDSGSRASQESGVRT